MRLGDSEIEACEALGFVWRWMVPDSPSFRSLAVRRQELLEHLRKDFGKLRPHVGQVQDAKDCSQIRCLTHVGMSTVPSK